MCVKHRVYQLLITFSFCLIGVGVNAQSTIDEPYNVHNLMERFVMYNRNEAFRGIKIMVSLSRDRRKIELAKQKFERLFPDYSCEMIYSNPYYKLHTGAFRNKSDAIIMLSEIRDVFPGATDVIAEVTNSEIYSTYIKERYGND